MTTTFSQTPTAVRLRDRRRRLAAERPPKPGWVPPKYRPVLRLEHAWLAGIIDGEGCISVRRKDSPTPSVELVVGMTCERTILRCREIVGIGTVSRRPMQNRTKPLWAWSVYSVNAKGILWLLLPLLVTKHEQAREALGEGVI